MMLWDVGMTAMVAMELKALANLSRTAFDPPRTADHAKHTQRLAELHTLLNEQLWNDDLGIYSNKLSFSESQT